MAVSILNSLGRSKISMSDTSHIIDYYRNDLDRSGSRFGHTDTVLIVDDGALPVHGALLGASSSWFRGILQSHVYSFHQGTREILMPGFSLRIMKLVLELMYQGECSIPSESVGKEVISTIKYLQFHAADKLEVVRKGGQSSESRPSSVSASGQHSDRNNNNSSRQSPQATSSGITRQIQPAVSAKPGPLRSKQIVRAPPSPPIIRISESSQEPPSKKRRKSSAPSSTSSQNSETTGIDASDNDSTIVMIGSLTCNARRIEKNNRPWLRLSSVLQ